MHNLLFLFSNNHILSIPWPFVTIHIYNAMVKYQVSLATNIFCIVCPIPKPLLSEFVHSLLPVCSAVNKSPRQIHAKAIYTTLSLLSWLHVGSPSLLARAEHSHEQMWNHTQRSIHLFRALDKVSWRPGSHFQNVLVFTGSFNTDAITFLLFWKKFTQIYTIYSLFLIRLCTIHQCMLFQV